ncbi:hypothetical protein [Actinokineospora spheciospongiae]|uniref:hypothetical protein n=1 Tax=Actinokineospora spheciospongiae TaxID=909613 RepID=UPI00054FEBE5|nr:hypothetical protein [Actinokineospora spheciospongiae]
MTRQEPPPRRVEFNASGPADVPGLTPRLEALGFHRSDLTPRSTWLDQDVRVAYEFSVSGDSGTDVSALLIEACDRVARAEPELLVLAGAGFGILFSVVLGVTGEDEVNSSFVLEAAHLALLSRIGADLETALYVF